MSESEANAATLDPLLVRPPRRRGWILAAAGSLVAALTALLLLRAGGAGPQQRFETVTVERTDLSAVVSTTGNLEPTNQVDVGSELSGTVAEVLVDTNDSVEAGQTLARLDPTKLEQQTERSRAALLSARAQLAQAQATRDQAAADLARFEEASRLSAGRLPARTELESARAASLRADAAVSIAEAAIAEAEAGLRANETDLTKMVIRAPIDGVVLARKIEPGQTVAASFQAPLLFTLAQDLRRMELTVNVAEADVGSVAPGQRATFTVDAWPDKRFDALVKKVSFGSVTVDNVVSYEAELEVANVDLSLRPGMTATADIRVAERTGVLAVPNAALRFSPPVTPEGRSGFSLPRPPGSTTPRPSADKSPGVYVLREGRLLRLDVTSGLSDGRRTEVSGSDLVEGDEVVVALLETES